MSEKIVIIGNGIDWLDGCYSGFQADNVFYNNNRIPLKSGNRGIDLLIRCWFSVRDRKHLVIQLPFRSIWYRFSVFRGFISENDKIKFIIYDHNRISLDKAYVAWLRKKYKNCSVSYVFTNIASKSGAGDYGALGKLNKMYDHVFAFDEEDSRKYGFEYNYLIYKPDTNVQKPELKYDCLFVGNAKERLDLLHGVYKKLVTLGLNPCFYINGVPVERQLKNSSIIYNIRIPYTKTIELTLSSKCIIDLLQDGSTGVALRICEAVVWNKLVITDNAGLVKEKFYSDNNIRIIGTPDDITRDFFENTPNVDSRYAYLFSPEHLFELIT